MSEFVDVLNMLSTDVIEVEFNKKTTGEVRIMTCTTDLTKIPEDKHPKKDGNPNTVNESTDDDGNNDTLYKVFDINIQAWRAFYLSKVTRVEVSDLTVDENFNIVQK